MTFEEIIPIIQLSISPVIVISGVGLILLSMTNRYGRVIDRARRIAELLRGDTSNIEAGLKKQREILLHRARVLRLAISFATASILFAALLIIALFSSAVLHAHSAELVIALFITCLLCLIAGIAAFMADINISLKALKIELHLEEH